MKVKIKVNPAYPADAVGDELLGVTFTKNEWTEVNGGDWKRLKESTGRMWNGEYSIPMLIEEGSDGEIKPVIQTSIDEDNSPVDSDEEADNSSEEWYGTEEEQADQNDQLYN